MPLPHQVDFFFFKSSINTLGNLNSISILSNSVSPRSNGCLSDAGGPTTYLPGVTWVFPLPCVLDGGSLVCSHGHLSRLDRMNRKPTIHLIWRGCPFPGHPLPDSGIPGSPRMTSAVLELIKGRTDHPWNLPVFSPSSLKC